MHFEITHETIYHYSKPVRLGPQTIRLRPRCEGGLALHRLDLIVDPEPAGRSECLDLEGNVVTQLWFDDPSDHLRIRCSTHVETTRHNPFDFLPESSRDSLYTPELTQRLSSYLAPVENTPAVRALSARLASQFGHDALGFLEALNRHLFEHIEHETRELGPPQAPLQTLKSEIGACRDVTVLFMEICRLHGIAARFVSGYQKGETWRERRYMHAWPEVYLPGGGWRGYDPTHGLAVADEHVPVAAAASPDDAAPVEGTYSGDADTHLEAQVEIRVHE